MKPTLTILLILISSFILRAQNNWITFKADERLSIKSPAKPQDDTRGNYLSFEADSSVIYSLGVIDLKEMGGDSTIIKQIIKNPEFALKMREFAMRSFKAVKMEDFTAGEWKGFTSYRSSGTDQQMKMYDMLMFFVDYKMYNLTTVRLPKIGNAKVEQFFTSADIKP